jgi:zinc and cadmium transporter
MTIYFSLFILGLSAVFLTLLSGSIPLLRHWKEDHLHGFVSFSAGVLIATAFLHLLPEAIERTPAHQVGYYILASFIFLFILEKFVMLHPCEETHCDYHTIGIAAFFGLMTHTLFDGFILGAALMTPGLATIVFFAIMAHKIPSAFALSSILRKARWKKSKIILFLTIFGSVIPFGALCSLTFLKPVEGGSAVGIALSLSLGTFIYISTSDFLPEVHRAGSNRFRNLAAFIAGLILTGILGELTRGLH